SDTPRPLGAKPPTGPQWAVHVPPASRLAVRAAEMGAAIRGARVGDFPGETETAEPLTSHPEPWSPPSGCFRHGPGPCGISAHLSACVRFVASSRPVMRYAKEASDITRCSAIGRLPRRASPATVRSEARGTT